MNKTASGIEVCIGALILLLAGATRLNAQDLGFRQMRRELGLSHEVSVKILEALNNDAELHSGGLMSREMYKESQKKKEQLRRQAPPEGYARKALSYLTPAQKKRLDQIQTQHGWPYAFEDFRFAQRVGVTKEQYRKMGPSLHRVSACWLQEVQSFWKSNNQWYFKLDRKRNARRFAAAGETMRRIGERRLEEERAIVLSSLTETQRAKWKVLCGKPFRLTDFHSEVKPVPAD